MRALRSTAHARAVHHRTLLYFFAFFAPFLPVVIAVAQRLAPEGAAP